MDFFSIEYLKTGSNRQREAYTVIRDYQLMEKLESFNPLLAGTIPLEIDVEGSDLDILCSWKDKSSFEHKLRVAFDSLPSFRLRDTLVNGVQTVIANFVCGDFDVEVFGQPKPVFEQDAYRHMVIEYKLLLKHGVVFRDKVVALKRSGIKTEAAFAQLLKLSGNPYEALLNLK